MDDEEYGLHHLFKLLIENPPADFKCYESCFKAFKPIIPRGLFQGSLGVHEFCDVLELDKYISFLFQKHIKIFKTREISSLK